MKRNELIIKKNKKGYGVYASKAYGKGDVICVMRGVKCKPRTLYYHSANFKNAQINPLQIGAETYLELKRPFLYINHSCDPNAGITGVCTLFAIKNIRSGQEITYDYSTTIDESFWRKCKSGKCRGAIADFFTLPARIQLYYVRRGAIPTFISKKYKRINPVRNPRVVFKSSSALFPSGNTCSPR